MTPSAKHPPTPEVAPPPGPIDWQPLIVIVQRLATEARVVLDALPELEKLGQAESRRTALEAEAAAAETRLETLRREETQAILQREADERTAATEAANRLLAAREDYDAMQARRQQDLKALADEVILARQAAGVVLTGLQAQRTALQTEIAALTIQRDALQAEFTRLTERFAVR